MAVIELTRGLNCIVDDSDYPELSKFRWYAHGGPGRKYYTARRDKAGGKRFVVYMHRHILNPPAHMHVDHIDRDTLNNQRENLRLASLLCNCATSSYSASRPT